MRYPAAAAGSIDVSGAEVSLNDGLVPVVPSLEVPVEASLKVADPFSTEAAPRSLNTNAHEVVRLERSLEAKLPQNLLALPSGWTVDVHEREDQPGKCFIIVTSQVTLCAISNECIFYLIFFNFCASLCGMAGLSPTKLFLCGQYYVACFHAYVSPVGVQYSSVRAALESLHEAPVSSDDALPPALVPVPPEFMCPVGGTLLQDPVLCMEDGHTYERSAVAGRVEPKNLVPNRLLKALIQDWMHATSDGPSSSSGGSVVAIARAEAAAAAPPAPAGEHGTSSPARPLKRPLGSLNESDASKRPFGEPREPSRGNFSRDAPPSRGGDLDRRYGREGRGRSEDGQPERRRQDGSRARDSGALLQTPPHSEGRGDSRGSWADERRSERGSNFSRGSPPRLANESQEERGRDLREPQSADAGRGSLERSRNDAEHSARRYPDDKLRGAPFPPRDSASSSIDQSRGFSSDTREGRPERSPPRRLLTSPLRLPSGLLEHKEFIRLRRDAPLEAVRAKLLGDNYENINHIENECGVQLRLRGSSLASSVSTRGRLEW